MLYCTFEQYRQAGGVADEQAFALLCTRASHLIDGVTFGRAESHAAGCEDCRAALTDACCQIIGLLAAQQAVGTVPGAASTSNDGWSVTFANGTNLHTAARQEAADILRSCLGADPHNLLYRGCL